LFVKNEKEVSRPQLFLKNVILQKRESRAVKVELWLLEQIDFWEVGRFQSRGFSVRNVTFLKKLFIQFFTFYSFYAEKVNFIRLVFKRKLLTSISEMCSWNCKSEFDRLLRNLAKTS
jgi:hypothetical protein